MKTRNHATNQSCKRAERPCRSRPAKMPTRTATVTTVGIFSRIVIRLLMVRQFILTEAQNRSDLGNLLSSVIRTSGARRFVGKPIDDNDVCSPPDLSRAGWGRRTEATPHCPKAILHLCLDTQEQK